MLKLYVAVVAITTIIGGAWIYSSSQNTSEQQLGALTILKVQQGGTGAATFTDGLCLVGHGTGPFTSGACSGGSGGAAYPFTPSSTYSTSVSATTTALQAPTFFATSTVATSTFDGPTQFGVAARNNYMAITIPRTYPASQSVGGGINIDNTLNNGSALTIWTNHTSGATAPLFRLRSEQTTFDQTLLDVTSLSQSSTAFGLSCINTLLGCFKATHTGNGADANVAAISIDLTSTSTQSAAQGILITSSATGTTGAILNLSNIIVAGDPATSLLKLTASGNFGLSTSTPGSTLSVNGNQFIAGNITSTSTTASIFPYASSTGISITGMLFAGASSTIGGGTQTTGLSVSGNSTTSVSGTATIPASLAIMNTGSQAAQQSNLLFGGFSNRIKNAIRSILGAGGGTSDLVFSYGDGATLEGARLAGSNGNFGISTTTPWARLSIGAPANNFTQYLFAISSSTASATTTLFTIDYQGTASTTNLIDSALVSGNCVQAGAGGLLATVAGACGTSSGAAYSFTPGTWAAVQVSATSTTIWNKASIGFIASSSIIDYASSTAISASSAAYVGTTATTPYLQVGSTTPPSGMGNVAGNLIMAIGSDNSINGVETGILNTSPGTSAYTCNYLNNDKADSSLTHFAAFCLNSFGYTDTTFGTGVAFGGLAILQNTEGALALISSTSTTNSRISMFTGGAAAANERIRITSTGNVGIASTTPWALLSVQPSGLLNNAPAFVVGSSTALDFQVSQYGDVGGCVTQYGATGWPATSTAMVLDFPNTCNTIVLNVGTAAYTVTWKNATTTQMAGHRKFVQLCNPGSTGGAATLTNAEWSGTAPTLSTTLNQCASYSVLITPATSTPSGPTFKMLHADNGAFQ